MPTTLLHGETWEQARSRRFSEEARDDERITWIVERTEQIISDKDYRLDIAGQIALDHPELLLAMADATSADYISAIGAFNEKMAKRARTIAKSEANIHFAYVWN
ncbi:MAG: hypothetical protein IPH08_20165 [Rhodocyclaceae bacterium]|jgi:hypothetical protein|nr:hypothetical protein [Rhodocyclaceae bacterium]MBK6909308.1 hypothetical protein [Rhodocyclaceae bacterium]